jgi:hypothetical protein
MLNTREHKREHWQLFKLPTEGLRLKSTCTTKYTEGLLPIWHEEVVSRKRARRSIRKMKREGSYHYTNTLSTDST